MGNHVGSRSVLGFFIIVAVTNGGHRTPEVVMITRIEHRDQAVRPCDGYQREQTGTVDHTEPRRDRSAGQKTSLRPPEYDSEQHDCS